MNIKTRCKELLDKASFVLLCVLMADCCVTGAGRLIEFGPVGGRMVLFFLLFLTTLPTMLREWRTILKNRLVQIVICFLALLIIQGVRGVVVGNNREILVTDVKGFLYFGMVPIAICVLSDEKRIQTLMKVMMLSSLILACVAVGYLVLYTYDVYLFQKLTQFIIPQEGTTTGMIAFTALNNKQLRVFCYSGLYFLCACSFSCYFFFFSKDRKFEWYQCLLTALSLLVLLISFTRSVYLATFLTLMFLMLLLLQNQTGRDMKRRFLRYFGSSFLMFAVLLVGTNVITGGKNLDYALTRVLLTFESAEATNELEEAPSESIEAPTQLCEDIVEPTGQNESEYDRTTIASDGLRNMTVTEYKENIAKNPLFGNGLGVYLKCRDDGYGEYFYLDLISKMGVVGLISFFAPICVCAYYMVEGARKGKQNFVLLGCWIAPVLGMMGYSYFNPYMNAALGLLPYSIVIAVASWYHTADK